MIDSADSEISLSTPGVLEEPPGPRSREVVTLSPAEHALYASGIRRGHCEALRQAAGQLRSAVVAYRAKLAGLKPGRLTKAQLGELLESALAGYDSFAEQLEVESRKVCREQQALLGRFVASKPPPGLADRLAAAARGALGGWRGR